MKIAVLQNPGHGGSDHHLAHLLLAAKEAGHDAVIFGKCREDKNVFEEYGLQFHPTELPPWRKPLRRLAHTLHSWFGGDSFQKQIGIFQPDVVIAGDIWTAPHVLHLAQRMKSAGVGFVQADGLKDGSLQKYHIDALPTVLTPSEYMRRQLTEHDVGADRIFVVRPGVDLDRFRPGDGGAAARANLGLPKDAFIVGCMGTISADKGQDCLVDVAALLPGDSHLHFLLIGADDRPFAWELKRRISDSGLQERVTFCGFKREVPDLLSACDAFAVPSKKESFSLALAEAMAAGLPVVYSGAGGMDEVVGDCQAAIRIPTDNPSAWLEAFLKFESEPERRNELSITARHHAEAYLGIEAGNDAFLQVLERACAGDFRAG